MLRYFIIKSSDDITVTGVTTSDVVKLKGFGGYLIDSVTAAGSTVTLSLPYGRASIIDVNGDEFEVENGIIGGDEFSYV